MSSRAPAGTSGRNGMKNVLAGNFCYYPAANRNIAALVSDSMSKRHAVLGS
jgi:hypothetical protein